MRPGPADRPYPHSPNTCWADPVSDEGGRTLKRFGGSVTLSGRACPVVVEVGTLGRIRVFVEGRVEFSKTPLATSDTIAVTLLGTPAVVRFRATEFEVIGGCEIVVDATATPLARLVASGRSETPEEARARHTRYGGITALCVGIGLLALNFGELQSGYYYPKLLWLGAAAIPLGALAAVHPRWLTREVTPGTQVFFIVVLSGAALFSWWFVSAFGSTR